LQTFEILGRTDRLFRDDIPRRRQLRTEIENAMLGIRLTDEVEEAEFVEEVVAFNRRAQRSWDAILEVGDRPDLSSEITTGQNAHLNHTGADSLQAFLYREKRAY